MSDVRERVMLATILQKDIFSHNFSTKALRLTILMFISMFLRSRNPMMPFMLPYDFDLSRSSPMWNHILGHISGINITNIITWFTVIKVMLKFHSQSK